jgi:hypothetical protein
MRLQDWKDLTKRSIVMCAVTMSASHGSSIDQNTVI